jgi:hypothetical protein
VSFADLEAHKAAMEKAGWVIHDTAEANETVLITWGRPDAGRQAPGTTTTAREPAADVVPDPPSAEEWLLPYEPESPGAMRFFLQPRWADGEYSIEHGIRVRDKPSYRELEVLTTLDDEGHHAVAVVYVLTRQDPGPVTVAASFGTAFTPLEEALCPAGQDPHAELTHRQQLFLEEIRRVRPVFFTAFANGLFGDLAAGAVIDYADPADGVTRNILATVTNDRSDGGAVIDGELVGFASEVFRASLEVFAETLNQPDLEGVDRKAELRELRDTAGTAGKWLLNNASVVRDIAAFVTG